jgi:hypothetical protein
MVGAVEGGCPKMFLFASKFVSEYRNIIGEHGRLTSFCMDRYLKACTSVCARAVLSVCARLCACGLVYVLTCVRVCVCACVPACVSRGNVRASMCKRRWACGRMCMNRCADPLVYPHLAQKNSAPLPRGITGAALEKPTRLRA